MTTRVLSWGLLVSAALPSFSGCSAAPQVAVAPTIEPLASAPPPAPPPAPSGPFGLGPVLHLSPDDAAAVPSTRTFFGLQRQRVFFGRGVLVSASVPNWPRAPRACPILDTQDVCAVFSLTLTGQDPADEGWRTGEAAGKAAPRTIVGSFPTSWGTFSGGREVIYGFPGSAAGVIDQIDDKGEVRPFLQSDTLGDWSRLAVVEVGERRFVIGHADSSPLQVGEALPGASGQPRTLGTLTELGMAPVPSYRKSAQGARQIEEQKKRPMYGPIVAVPTRDDKASKGGGWALAWVEVLPPPFGWPTDKPYKRRGRHDCGGGPTSRPLTVKSIEKRVHVTRFDGTRQTSDKVVLSLETFDEDSSPFFVRPTDKGIEINGVTYDRNGKSVETRTVKTPALVPEPMAPDEQVVATSFDAASNEGAVVYWSGDKARWRKFDGQGKPKGKSLALAGDPTKGSSLYDGTPLLTFTTGGWWLSDLSDSQMLSLDRDSLSPGPQNWVVGFFPGGDSPVALEVQGHILSHRRFDPKAGTFAEQSEPFENQLDDFPGVNAFSGGSVESSLLAFRPGKDGAPPTLARLTASSGEWHEITGAIPEEIGHYKNYTMRQVWGDVVVVVEGTEGTAATWLRVGKTRFYAKKENSEKPAADVIVGELPRNGLFGPVVNNGAAMLPARPGGLIETPDLEGIGTRCEHIVPTAPGVITLVCAEAVSKDKPGTRVGIQTYRFRE